MKDNVSDITEKERDRTVKITWLCHLKNENSGLSHANRTFHEFFTYATSYNLPNDLKEG